MAVKATGSVRLDWHTGIVERWRGALGALGAAGPPRLDASVDELLAAIARWLQGGAQPAAPELQELSDRLLVELRGGGDILSAISSEFRVLRSCVTEMLDRAALPVAYALDCAMDHALRRFVDRRGDALYESEVRAQLAVDAAGLGTWSFDPQTLRRSLSPRAKQLFGYTSDTEISQELFLAAVHPDDRARVTAALARALDPASDGEYVVEYRTIADGTERWVQAMARRLCLDGRSKRLVGTMQDITARKRRERERELFIDVLAHDLRAPLNAIGLVAQQLRRRGDEAVTRGAARIAASAARMNRLIRDLLEFSRIRGGPPQLQPADVDLGELAREVIDELTVLDPGRVELTTSGATLGHWDRDRMAQLVQNLVANALTHGEAGASVRVRVDGDRESATLTVANSGEPIPEALQASIFDPFRRAEGSAGLGLGLYIVKRIADAHAGAVDVHSDARETVFRVRLPRAPSAE